jgi:N6-adenosine-specific RNA methylase IME4
MTTTFAAYIPVYVPQTHLLRAHKEYQPSNTPYQPPTHQDILAFGIIALISLSGFLFLAITDRN